MRLKDFLFRLILIMPLFSNSDCLTSGSASSATRICKNCERAAPTEQKEITEDALFHLEHADPCHSVCEEDSDIEKKNASELCMQLVELYRRSKFYSDKKEYLCPNPKAIGCKDVLLDSRHHCMVEIPGLIYKSRYRLWWCIEDSYGKFLKKPKYGAMYPVSQTPRAEPQIQRKEPKYGAMYPVSQTPRAEPQIQRTEAKEPPRKGRGSSQSPPRFERGRAPSQSSSRTFWLSKSKRSKSHSPIRKPLLCDYLGR